MNALLVAHPEFTSLRLDTIHNIHYLLDCPWSEMRRLGADCEPQDGSIVSCVVEYVLDCDLRGTLLDVVFKYAFVQSHNIHRYEIKRNLETIAVSRRNSFVAISVLMSY